MTRKQKEEISMIYRTIDVFASSQSDFDRVYRLLQSSILLAIMGVEKNKISDIIDFFENVYKGRNKAVVELNEQVIKSLKEL